MLKKIKEHISNLSNEPIEMADQEQKIPKLSIMPVLLS